jgi:hypothetical protein
VQRAADSTGVELIARGCRQGALLAAPARMIWLYVAQPANANGVDWEVGDELLTDMHLVISSQDCDIAAQTNVEPFVEALTARWTTEPKEILAARKRNSARLYLLVDERERILVADASRKVQILKGCLKDAAFAALLQGERERTRFGLWVGGRYSRPAIEDAIVKALHRPLAKALDKLTRKKGVVLDALDRVTELRFLVAGEPPWTADFIAMLEEGKELTPEEEADLSGWLEETLVVTDGAIERIRILFRTAKSISLHDYESTTHLSFDHFSDDAQTHAA